MHVRCCAKQTDCSPKKYGHPCSGGIDGICVDTNLANPCLDGKLIKDQCPDDPAHVRCCAKQTGDSPGPSQYIKMPEVASLWKSNGGSSSTCAMAVAVAWAESRGCKSHRENNDKHRSCDRGLWQINSYWHRDLYRTRARMIKFAMRNMLYISNGGKDWTPWATYNDGLHTTWMNDARERVVELTIEQVIECSYQGKQGKIANQINHQTLARTVSL